eukprot:10415463-Ditylum_brightwellii.AAC.1
MTFHPRDIDSVFEGISAFLFPTLSPSDAAAIDATISAHDSMHEGRADPTLAELNKMKSTKFVPVTSWIQAMNALK